MKKTDYDQACLWVTVHAAEYPTGLTAKLAEHFGVTRAAAGTLVARLEADGWLVRQAAGTRPRFAPGPRRRVMRSYTLPGVDESLLWERDFSPLLPLSPNVANIAHYGFTEMVNNANDHADGRTLTVGAEITLTHLTLLVDDDGIGVFRKIADALKLTDLRQSLLELAKGKFSTDPQRHSGEGIFFASRAFDTFLLVANHLAYEKGDAAAGETVQERLEEWREDGRGLRRLGGTSVYMSIRLDSPQTLRHVFEHYTTGAPEDLTFDRTVIPVRLARLGNENLLSRSQAKRLIDRIDRFRVVELDFTDVPEIGQAFADELFRVFANAHPQVQLVPVQANEGVMRMIARAKGAGAVA
jgi:hypothetical protein